MAGKLQNARLQTPNKRSQKIQMNTQTVMSDLPAFVISLAFGVWLLGFAALAAPPSPA